MQALRAWRRKKTRRKNICCLFFFFFLFIKFSFKRVPFKPGKSTCNFKYQENYRIVDEKRKTKLRTMKKSKPIVNIL
jgi:hypothetical protein